MAKLNTLHITFCVISSILKLASSQCDLTCENVDDDFAEIVEQMDDLRMCSFINVR